MSQERTASTANNVDRVYQVARKWGVRASDVVRLVQERYPEWGVYGHMKKLSPDQLAALEAHYSGDLVATASEHLPMSEEDTKMATLAVLTWIALHEHHFAPNKLQQVRQLAAQALISERAMTSLEALVSGTPNLDVLVGRVQARSAAQVVLGRAFLFALTDDGYDARSRSTLISLADALGLGEKGLLAMEAAVTLQHDTDASALTKARSGKKKAVVAGAVVIGAAAAVAATGGLGLIPLIGGAVGSAGTSLAGAAAVSHGLAVLGGGALAAGGYGMAGGALVIQAGAALLGGSAVGLAAAKRTANVKEFAFVPVGGDGPRLVVGISGFLSQDSEPAQDWAPLVNAYPSCEAQALRWESKALRDLGKALVVPGIGVAAKQVAEFMAARALKRAGGAFVWPAVALAALDVLNNPWSLAKSAAEKTGVALAEVLTRRDVLGARPVSLVGFSLGARVIYYALKHMDDEAIARTVESVTLLGGAVGGSPATWSRIRAAVTGRFVNGYSTNDVVLAYLYRTASLGEVAVGSRPLAIDGVANVDLTERVGGHLDYSTQLDRVLVHVRSHSR